MKRARAGENRERRLGLAAHRGYFYHAIRLHRASLFKWVVFGVFFRVLGIRFYLIFFPLKNDINYHFRRKTLRSCLKAYVGNPSFGWRTRCFSLELSALRFYEIK